MLSVVDFTNIVAWLEVVIIGRLSISDNEMINERITDLAWRRLREYERISTANGLMFNLYSQLYFFDLLNASPYSVECYYFYGTPVKSYVYQELLDWFFRCWRYDLRRSF